MGLALLRVVLSGSSQREVVLPPGPDGLPSLIQEARQAQAEDSGQSRAFGPGETLDPNRARAQEMDRLPGIGISVAQAIVSYRRSLELTPDNDNARQALERLEAEH